MAVTRRQKQILDFLVEFRQRHGYSPSLEEIRSHLGLSAVSTIHRHLENMAAEGIIRRERHRSRSALPSPGGAGAAGGGTGVVQVSLLGVVAAGAPLEVYPVPETITLPEELAGGEGNYALRVRGDSMVEDGILDGDIIIVERRETARNSEVVVALVGGNEVTVKRYYREGGVIRLQPANARMAPIYAPEAEVRIQGVVVGLMRKFE